MRRISDEEQGLKAELDMVERELLGVQEMLAHVLLEVGEPVVVTKAKLAEGLPAGVQIYVEENTEDETFVFSLVKETE